MFSFVFFGIAWLPCHSLTDRSVWNDTQLHRSPWTESQIAAAIVDNISAIPGAPPPPRPRSKVLNDNWNLSIGHRHQNRRFCPICGHFWIFYLGRVGVDLEAALDQDLSAYCVSPANKLLLPSLNFKHISCSMAPSSLDAKYTLGQDILSNTYTLVLPLKIPHPDLTWETKEWIVLVSIFRIIKSIESTGMAETMMSMV